MRFKDLFVYWVEACIVFVHLPGTTSVTPGTNANEGEDTHKVWMVKNPIYPGHDLGRGGQNTLDVKFIHLM